MSSFIGRREQIEAVASHLHTSRLVTLTGVGGVGKTRLAVQVARRLNAEYTCSLAALSAVEDGGRVSSAVAAKLGGGEEVSSASVDTLVSSIRDDGLLLVLDNCEHLIDACAELVVRLLQDCAGVRVLATN